jgi:hypothetical protein
MIYICGLHAGINYYKLAVEKDRDFIFTITTIYMETRLKNTFTALVKISLHG